MIARADCAKRIQEDNEMRESKFKNYDALPLTLTAPEVGEVLGISRAAAYEFGYGTYCSFAVQVYAHLPQISLPKNQF